MKTKSKVAYMCGVAWQHELGDTDVQMFATPKQCAKAQPCTGRCGIAKVSVRFVGWAKRQKFPR